MTMAYIKNEGLFKFYRNSLKKKCFYFSNKFYWVDQKIMNLTELIS
jgi:hypothetical protein